MQLDRRQLLAMLAATAAVGRAHAFGDTTQVDIAELDLGAGTLSRPNAWRRLLYDLQRLTSTEVQTNSVRVPPEDPALFEHPFCVLLGADAFADPTDAQVEQLEQYLAYGGFLFIDDTVGRADSRFDGAVRRLLGRIFPTRPLAPLPPNHPVQRSFFLLKSCWGRVAVFPDLEAVVVGNQAPVIYCRNDVSGALDRDDAGQPRYPCVPSEIQRTDAMKLGINLLMYALTSDYKADQAHVKQLMLEKRIKQQ